MYSEEEKKKIKSYIIREIVKGRPITVICQDDGIPHVDTFYEWKRLDPDFSEDYAQAAEDRTHFYGEDVVRIADEAPETHEGIAKARLMIDARKWTCSITNPLKYNRKIHHDVVVHADMSERELDERISELTRKAGIIEASGREE